MKNKAADCLNGSRLILRADLSPDDAAGLARRLAAYADADDGADTEPGALDVYEE